MAAKIAIIMLYNTLLGTFLVQKIEKVPFSYFEDVFSKYSVQIWAATSTILAHGRLA